MRLKDYLRGRRLAFALKEVRDSGKSLLDIAFDYGFSSHEAFTRAFKDAYGVTPRAYRKNSKPVVLRTRIHPFDRYLLGLGEIGMVKTTDGVNMYFVTIPRTNSCTSKTKKAAGTGISGKDKNQIPGQDFDTICGLLDSVKGNWTTKAGAIPTAAAGILWRISATRRAGFAAGASRVRNVMGAGFPPIIKVRCRRRCSWPMSRRPSIWSLSTGRLIMSRKTAA